MKHLTHGRPRHLVVKAKGRRGSLTDLTPTISVDKEENGWLSNPFWQVGFAAFTGASAFYSVLALIPVALAVYWWFYNRNIDRHMLIAPTPVDVFSSNDNSARKRLAHLFSPLDDQSGERQAGSASANR